MPLEGWATVRLGELFAEIADRNNPDELPVLAVTLDRGVVRRDSLDRKMDREVEQGAYLRALPGDIAYNTMRMWQGGSGLVREPGFVSPAYTVVRPRGEDHSEFWAHAFKSPDLIRRFQAFSQGVAKDRHRLYYDQFAAVAALRPPLPEQRKIAAILTSVDETIEKTEAVIAQLEVVKKAMLEELLTRGIPGRHSRFKMTEIGEVPEEWSFGELGDVAVPDGLQTGPFGSQLKAEEYVEQGVPVVMPRDMRRGRIDVTQIARVPEARARDLSRHRLAMHDIVFARRGDIGRCALVTEHEVGWLCGTGSLRARLGGRAAARFVVHHLGTPFAVGWLTEHAVGQTMLNLNTDILARLPIQLPPLEEQELIANAIDSLDLRVDEERVHADLLRRLKATLAAPLLSGELRVRPGASVA